MKVLAVSQSSLGASIFSAPSFLRIAIPSWRAIGIQVRPSLGEEPESLSREEIQRLFHGDLDPWARKRPPLTDREKQEKSLADKMRAALYPDPAPRH